MVKWEGYAEPEWQRGHLLELDAKDAVRHFYIDNGLSPCKDLYPDPEGLNRCTVCAKTFKRPQDLKAHRTRTKHYDDAQEKIAPAAERKAKEAKKEAQQAKLPKVKWAPDPVKNCWQFEYLGAVFQADGSQMPDVRRRVAMAKQRHGKMRHVWKSRKLHPRLKLRLYIAGVCSVMVYGSETWMLTPAVRRLLNGANSQMVAIITDKTIREEATEATRTYDLVASIRATRLRWLGQILRMEEDRLVKKAVKTLHQDRRVGDILIDAPKASWRELCIMAADEKGWQQKVNAIKDNVHFTIKSKKKKKSDGGGKKRRQRSENGGKREDDSDESDGDNGWGAKKTRAHKPVNSVVRCYDGFRMSVQASRDHYCTPRQDIGPYTHVEVGYPNRLEELLLPYADGASTIAGLRPTLYVNVPADVVLAVIENHAGMMAGQLPALVTEAGASGESADEEDEDSAVVDQPTSVVHLGAPPPPPPTTIPPPLDVAEATEYDSNGYAWAAAAQPPSDTPSDETRCDSEGIAWAAAAQPPDDTPSMIFFDSNSGVMTGSPISPTSFLTTMNGQLPPPPALVQSLFSPIQTEHLMIEDIKTNDE